jgi:hypothetical protein
MLVAVLGSTRHRRALATLGSLAICASGCATGSARLITTNAQSESWYSTRISAVDGHVEDGSSIRLAPGRHSVEVVGRAVPILQGKPATTTTMYGALGVVLGTGIANLHASRHHAVYSAPLTTCFRARPGRTYEVRTYVEGGVWQIQVIDHTTTYDVKSACLTGPRPPSGNSDQQLRDPFDEPRSAPVGSGTPPRAAP